ncbi:MAG: gamma-glutamylcyclotransferase, partial [Saprospiraceae bacterium]|nr:gamma-glutamylcyclotransferase [Saprospiraceae bacterium]
MNLFTYGTLMIPEIISSLLGRNLTGVGALLKDYRRALILNQTYPGICRQGESQVEGVIYYQLKSHEIEILDNYEGQMYELNPVQVVLKSGDLEEAYVYVLKDEFKSLLSDKDWNLEAFLKND